MRARNSKPAPWAFALLLLLSGLAHSQELIPKPIARQLTACIEKHERASSGQTEDLSLKNICPELDRKLKRSKLSDFTYPEPHEKETEFSLSHVQDLEYFKKSTTYPEQRYQFDRDALTPILDQLKQIQDEKELSLWERFIQWLESLAQDEQSETDSKFIEWLKSLSKYEDAAKTLFNVTFVILVVLILYFVINEIRTSGLLGAIQRKNKRRPTPEADLGLIDLNAAKLQWSDIEAMPGRQKILLSFSKCVAHLIEARHIPDDNSLTARELGQRFEQHTQKNQTRFGTMIRRVEQCLYGDQAMADSQSREVMDLAQQLIEDYPAPGAQT